MTDHRLARHLSIAIVLKLVVTGALWWSFVRDTRVAVDAEAAGSRVAAPAGLRETRPQTPLSGERALP